MKRTIEVYCDQGPLVGMLYYDQQRSRETAAFEYAPTWLREKERFALSPALSLVAGPQFHKKSYDGSIFPSPIADKEPDGWGRRVIMRDHIQLKQEARRTGRGADIEPLNALDFLLATNDESRVGALRFRDEHGAFQHSITPDHRATPLLIELSELLAASRAVENNEETAADLAYLRGCGTSLGGLRPKCTIIDNNGFLSLGKFPSITDERSVTKGEVFALHLAKAAGTNAAESKLTYCDGTPVALIRRFDRLKNGARLMYISAATMLGVEPTDPREHFYTEIVDVIRMYSREAQADIEELWRRIAFSILITNVDDHLLNYGFLHEAHGLWRLAPAFDINPFPERVRELRTWLSKEAGPGATVDGLMFVIHYFRINPKRAKEILKEVGRSVSNWLKTGRDLGMTDKELEQFVDAFEHPELKAAQKNCKIYTLVASK